MAEGENTVDMWRFMIHNPAPLERICNLNETNSQLGTPSNRGLSPIVFCDFDGTITQVDVTDQILDQFAHPSWREIEQEWVLGRLVRANVWSARWRWWKPRRRNSTRCLMPFPLIRTFRLFTVSRGAADPALRSERRL